MKLTNKPTGNTMPQEKRKYLKPQVLIVQLTTSKEVLSTCQNVGQSLASGAACSGQIGQVCSIV